LYCNRCGNTLFFKKIINGCISIPLYAVEDLSEDGESQVYEETGSMEIISIHEEYYECSECSSQDIEHEERTNEKEDDDEDI
jgi:hypothetical protein